jgi:hypothetical protein
MRSETVETRERQIVVRGEFFICALVVGLAFVFVHWAAALR